jgi:excisionase family DNA binding protein
MNTLGETRLLTVGEVALKLRQSERTVRDKIACGDLPALRVGSGPRAPIRVPADELDAWLYRPSVQVGEASAAAGLPGPPGAGRSA